MYRGMAMTFWLPQAEVALAQVEEFDLLRQHYGSIQVPQAAWDEAATAADLLEAAEAAGWAEKVAVTVQPPVLPEPSIMARLRSWPWLSSTVKKARR